MANMSHRKTVHKLLDIRHHSLAIGKGNSYQAFFDTGVCEDGWHFLCVPPIKDDRLFTYQ